MDMKLKFLAIAFSSACAFGCKSPVYVQKDESANFAKYTSYMWVDTRNQQDQSARRTTAFADQAVHEAVNAELSKEGWKEVSSQPDVLVSYDLLVEKNVEQQHDPVYSQPFYRYYYNPFMRHWGTIYYPSQFLGYDSYSTTVKEGTVTITMVDAKTDKPIWQGWTTEQLSNAKFTDQEIEKSVRNIFKKFNAR